MSQQVPQPFKYLGIRLKAIREKRRESIAEVSGAVELDVSVLSRIERGELCPTEDILMLLISYFGMKDEEATKLWDLAGYGKEPASVSAGNDDTIALSKLVVLPIEARIVYTDTVHVMVNKYGVVMNFMQNGVPANQPLAVARVGMSKEHAKSVLKVLADTLGHAEYHAQPKALPKPENKAHDSNKQA